MKIFVITVLFLSLLSSMTFSNLGVSQQTILNGLEDFFNLSSGDTTGKERKDIVNLEIFGDENNPKRTSISFYCDEETELTPFLKEILLSWLNNVLHSSSADAFNWIINMIEINFDQTDYEFFKYYDKLKINIEKTKENHLVIMIEGKESGNIIIEEQTHPKYETPSGPPPSYLEEYNVWCANDGKSKYMPSYYQYPFSNFSSYQEEAEYNALLDALMLGYLDQDFLPGSYQYSPAYLTYDKNNYNDTAMIMFDWSGDDHNYIKTQNAPEKHKLVVEISPPNGGAVSFDNRNWSNKLTQTVVNGEGILIFAKTTDNYSFDGWYKNGYQFSGKNPQILDVCSYSHITAKFSKNSYLIVHNQREETNTPIKIPVSGKNFPQVTSFQLHINYDNDYIEPDYGSKAIVELAGPFKNYQLFKVSNEKKGVLSISGGFLGNQLQSVEDEIIMIISMRAKNKKGRTEILISEESKILGRDYQEIQLSTKEGTLEIN